MQTINDPELIRKGLRKIQTGKRTIILLFFGFIPASLLSSFVSNITKIHFMVFLGSYMAMTGIYNFYFGLTALCPRCNQFYFWKMSGIGYRNFFTNKCLSCGLDLKKLHNK